MNTSSQVSLTHQTMFHRCSFCCSPPDGKCTRRPGRSSRASSNSRRSTSSPDVSDSHSSHEGERYLSDYVHTELADTYGSETPQSGCGDCSLESLYKFLLLVTVMSHAPTCPTLRLYFQSWNFVYHISHADVQLTIMHHEVLWR